MSTGRNFLFFWRECDKTSLSVNNMTKKKRDVITFITIIICISLFCLELTTFSIVRWNSLCILLRSYSQLFSLELFSVSPNNNAPGTVFPFIFKSFLWEGTFFLFSRSCRLLWSFFDSFQSLFSHSHSLFFYSFIHLVSFFLRLFLSFSAFLLGFYFSTRCRHHHRRPFCLRRTLNSYT